MKKIIMTISNEGSAGKSTVAKLIKEALMKRNLPHATYLCDKDHQELVNTYGQEEVKFFSLREDRESLINALGEDYPYTIIDFPASSFDEIYNVFGDMETFIASFEMYDAVPVFVVPIASDKSILSVKRLHSLLGPVGGKYEIIYVLNNGLMKNSEETNKNFETLKEVQKQIKEGIANVVEIKTKFTPNFSNVVKTEKLRAFLEKKSNPMDKVLMFDLLKKSDEQFGKVLSLD